MMRLSTMWAVDREIYGDGRSPIIDRIVERWPHDEGSARFFRSSANFIATFQSNGRRRFLRFADSSERDRDTLLAEIDLVQWLAGEGFNVSMPELSLGGSILETVEVGDRTFHAVAFAACAGVQLNLEELDDEDFHRWGDALGSLHAALRSYPNSTIAARRSWRDDLTFIEAVVPPEEAAIRAELLYLQAALHALPTEPDHVGLIHFDFELDNLAWRDGSIAMLDFDDCASYWYAADIAFALRDLFDTGRALDDPLVRVFLDGYTARTTIDPAMVNAIPTFSRLSRLFTYARIMRSLDIDPGPEYPDWLNGLTLRLRDHSHAYRASLIG